MKILLHAPLHPTVWIYLMKMFPEHEWFIEPNDQFGYPGEEWSTPKHEVKYKVIPFEKREDIDIQIICLHLDPLKEIKIENILRIFENPIVWVQYWNTKSIPNPPRKLYPLVHTLQTDHSIYPKRKHIYMSPHPDMWKDQWEGTNPEVFAPIGGYKKSELIEKLEEQKIPLKLITGKRNISWSSWQQLFIKSRIFLEEAPKRGSSCLEEAMLVGMPVIVPNRSDFPLIVRNRIDGFSAINDNEKIEIIKKMLDSYDYAKEWGKKAKERAEVIFDIKKERKKWEEVFEEAIKVGPFEPLAVKCPHCGEETIDFHKGYPEHWHCHKCKNVWRMIK